MEKKFQPKPGDKIICNNGEEFICCTLEFLRKTVYEGIKSDKPIKGYRKFGYDEEWQDWDRNGYASLTPEDDYDIREVIPQSSEVIDDKKEEVKEEPRYNAEQALYTANEIMEIIENVYKMPGTPWEFKDNLIKHLDRLGSKEYQEYLRLKAIYE